MKIKGVIFDLDGTIVEVPYDWRRIRRRLGTGGETIIGYLNGLTEPDRSRKWAILRGYESRATRQARLRRGVRPLLALLTERGVRTALVTNNSGENVAYMLKKFRLAFDLVLTRDSGCWKPSGDPFVLALGRLGLSRRAAAVVGDSRFDVEAARLAGIPRVYLLSRDDGREAEAAPVTICRSVFALRHEIELGLAE